MLRLDVTVVHQYFVGSVMNNRKKGIKVASQLGWCEAFCITPAIKRKKKTAFGAVFFGRAMDLFRLNEAKYGECKSKNVRSRHFYAKVHD